MLRCECYTLILYIITAWISKPCLKHYKYPYTCSCTASYNPLPCRWCASGVFVNACVYLFFYLYLKEHKAGVQNLLLFSDFTHLLFSLNLDNPPLEHVFFSVDLINDVGFFPGTNFRQCLENIPKMVHHVLRFRKWFPKGILQCFQPRTLSPHAGESTIFKFWPCPNKKMISGSFWRPFCSSISRKEGSRDVWKFNDWETCSFIRVRF